MFDFQDFAANPGKYQLFRTARVPAHVFTANGENDIPAGAIVGVEFLYLARNQMRRREEPMYSVTMGGKFLGYMFASNLDQFTL